MIAKEGINALLSSLVMSWRRDVARFLPQIESWDGDLSKITLTTRFNWSSTFLFPKVGQVGVELLAGGSGLDPEIVVEGLLNSLGPLRTRFLRARRKLTEALEHEDQKPDRQDGSPLLT